MFKILRFRTLFCRYNSLFSRFPVLLQIRVHIRFKWLFFKYHAWQIWVCILWRLPCTFQLYSSWWKIGTVVLNKTITTTHIFSNQTWIQGKSPPKLSYTNATLITNYWETLKQSIRKIYFALRYEVLWLT